MDLTEIRRLVIVAMFSDDVLLDRLVLKGGNALRLVHRIGARASLDVDFSTAGDLTDIDDVENRIVRALKDRFDSAGYVVFDARLVERPSREAPRPKQWGGYRVEFKLAERKKYAVLREDPTALRRSAVVTGPLQQRVIAIDISKYEFCDGKEQVEVDHYTVYVYSRAMIAVEKLRAICQQMREYPLSRTPSARASDFYDVHALVIEGGVNVVQEENLFRAIFQAKAVPLNLLARIGDYREFHRTDWPNVRQTVTGELRDFDFYFDFVLDEVARLKSLWME